MGAGGVTSLVPPKATRAGLGLHRFGSRSFATGEAWV